MFVRFRPRLELYMPTSMGKRQHHVFLAQRSFHSWVTVGSTNTTIFPPFKTRDLGAERFRDFLHCFLCLLTTISVSSTIDSAQLSKARRTPPLTEVKKYLQKYLQQRLLSCPFFPLFFLVIIHTIPYATKSIWIKRWYFQHRSFRLSSPVTPKSTLEKIVSKSMESNFLGPSIKCLTSRAVGRIRPQRRPP